MSPKSRTQYTVGESETLSVGLINAISEAKGRDVTHDSSVLHDAIDVEALNALFSHNEGAGVRTSFVTHGARVELHHDGNEVKITVQDLETDDPTSSGTPVSP